MTRATQDDVARSLALAPLFGARPTESRGAIVEAEEDPREPPLHASGREVLHEA
jgi:hypothetical protein